MSLYENYISNVIKYSKEEFNQIISKFPKLTDIDFSAATLNEDLYMFIFHYVLLLDFINVEVNTYDEINKTVNLLTLEDVNLEEIKEAIKAIEIQGWTVENKESVIEEARTRDYLLDYIADHASIEQLHHFIKLL